MPVHSSGLLQFIIRKGYIYMLDNKDTQDVQTPPHGLTRLYYYSISVVTCMPVYYTDLHVCICTIVFKAILIINTTDSYGRVRMHAGMHLAFKELRVEMTC